MANFVALSKAEVEETSYSGIYNPVRIASSGIISLILSLRMNAHCRN